MLLLKKLDSACHIHALSLSQKTSTNILSSLTVIIAIPLNTGWTFGNFFTLNCCKNCIAGLNRPKINEKEAGIGPFFKKKMLIKSIPNKLFLMINSLMHKGLECVHIVSN